jgi:hypothetical protein
MAYGVALDVAGPVELYDALHAEFVKLPTEGLILHVGRPTAEGFQVLEVWESKAAYEEWTGRYVGGVMAALAAAGWAVPHPVLSEFEVRGLQVPQTAGS